MGVIGAGAILASNSKSLGCEGMGFAAGDCQFSETGIETSGAGAPA
jgi:hypothetical protein